MLDAGLSGEITVLLARWNEGDAAALNALASLAYDDLRAIANGFLLRQGHDHTLQATALVNELYMRLIRQKNSPVTSRKHFYLLAAMMMRRILSDYARRTHAQKRPEGQAVRVPLHEDMAWVEASGAEMLALDVALNALESVDSRAARIVELRYFLGCTAEEAADLMGISKATADRDLEFAKAWLFRRMNPQLKPRNP
jgi:RNA polymerase sigma factor (TIGR02999 family)